MMWTQSCMQALHVCQPERVSSVGEGPRAQIHTEASTKECHFTISPGARTRVLFALGPSAYTHIHITEQQYTMAVLSENYGEYKPFQIICPSFFLRDIQL